MVLKAEHAEQRILLVTQGLKKLFADDNFVNLLRAEGLDTLPAYLADRIQIQTNETNDEINDKTTQVTEGEVL